MKDNIPMLTQLQQKNAPWNQEELEPVTVDCSVCYCMSKTIPVKVENYTIRDGVEDFSDTNLIQEFKMDANTYGIPELLKVLETLVKEKLSLLEKQKNNVSLTCYGDNQVKVKKLFEYYQRILKAVQDWTVDDLDVVMDK